MTDRKDDKLKRTRGLFLASPEDLIIKGYDDADNHHPLSDRESNRTAVPDSLVSNIEAIGQLDPVTVVRDGDQIVVADGRMRVRAIRFVNGKRSVSGMPELPVRCQVVRGSDTHKTRVMAVSNVLRREMGPAQLSQYAAQLFHAGLETGEIAQSMGRSPNSIRLYLRFDELTDPTKEAVKDGLLTFTEALELCGLSSEQQLRHIESVKCADEPKPQKKARPKKVLSTSRVRRLVQDEEFWSGLSADARALLLVLAGETESVADVPGLAERIKEEEL